MVGRKSISVPSRGTDGIDSFDLETEGKKSAGSEWVGYAQVILSANGHPCLYRERGLLCVTKETSLVILLWFILFLSVLGKSWCD